MNVFLQNSQPNFHFPFTDSSQQLILRNKLNLWLNQRAARLITMTLFQTDDFTALSLA